MGPTDQPLRMSLRVSGVESSSDAGSTRVEPSTAEQDEKNDQNQ